MKGKKISCEICGEDIDVTACNQDRGIFTVKRDSDENGTTTDRVQLCGYCANRIYTQIQIEALEKNS